MNTLLFFQHIRRKAYYRFRKLSLKIPNYLYKNKENHYLFILSPPFCGSTLLNQLISTSSNVSCNNNIGTREGQTLPEVKTIMFDNNRWNTSAVFPWKDIKTIWHKYWDLSKPILLDKSTPNIIRVKDLKKTFDPISFICIVRNPYAQCEGIIRRNKQSAETAAKFVLNCLKYQKENIENEKNLIFFTYEDLCDNTNDIVNSLISFIPELVDINAKKRFSAHNFKTKKGLEITNLNSEKIKRINQEQLKEINKHFAKEKALLKYFNYSII